MERNEPAIVVEDDLLLHPQLHRFQLAQDPSSLKNYDFVLLASQLREQHLLKKLPDGRVNQGLHRYNGMFFLLHLYYLTPQGAGFFMEGALPMQYQVDSYMGFKLKQYPEFRSGVHIPDMGSQSDTTTDIQTPLNETGQKPLMAETRIRITAPSSPYLSPLWRWIGLVLLLLLVVALVYVILYLSRLLSLTPSPAQPV